MIIEKMNKENKREREGPYFKCALLKKITASNILLSILFTD